MLRHCVFVNLKDSVDAAERDAVLSGFGTLVEQVDGMLDSSWGPNLDFEAKSPDYTWGFIVTFRDRTAHLAYEQHPIHKELGAKLVAMCKGGHAGILVFDLQET